MQDHSTGRYGEPETYHDLDGDGGVTVQRIADYVKVHTWGGAAGANGCTTYLSFVDATMLANAIRDAATDAAFYGDRAVMQ